MTTTEANKLIAIFDGYEFIEDGILNKVKGYYRKIGKLPMLAHELKYHSSWDWLMPVVEKIENSGCIIEIWMSLGRGCRIINVVKRINITRESNSAIESVFLAVTDFITWHNQNK